MPINAVLTGTFRNPELRFSFGWGASLPNGKPAQDWIKNLPGRRWDKSEKTWYITGTGINPDIFFADLGIEVDFSEATGDLEGFTSLEPLWRPLVQRSGRFPSTAFVRARLAGYDRVSALLGPGAIWDKKFGRFTVMLSDLVDNEAKKRGLIMDDRTFEAAIQALQRSTIPENVQAAARELACSTGVEEDTPTELSERTKELVEVVAAHTGHLPPWFGLALYPFQVAGAYAIVGGHNLLADSPGLGKTRQALAAAAIRRSRRTVIVVPPLVVENWCREAYTALGPGLKRIQPKEAEVPAPAAAPKKSRAKAKRKPPRAPDFPPYIVPIRAGKKVPPFPEAGVVVVADSLLASRPELLTQLIEWEPQASLFDEVHRARTFTGVRATAERNLSTSIDALRIPMTGTPFLQNPVEITNMLAIGGQLGPVFGGPSKFIERYAKQNHFGAFLPNRKMLPELRERLNESCWVRRNKQDVLKQLPPKMRSMRFVDIDPKGFKEAHQALYLKISEWIDEQFELGERVDEAAITKFAKERIDLITPLRAAAGVAKVPAAIDIITDWLESSVEEGPGGAKKYTRPLTVWIHHRPVMEALVAAIPENLAGVGFIDGGVPQHKRQEVADRLQNGEIGVIVCSIGAAGFGITLTASSDAFFVETDWTPANISQAEDRNHRIGQTEPVMITTLMAANTLDAHMRAILKNKAKDLNVLMPGADNNVTQMTAHLNEDENVYELITEEDKDLEKRFKSLSDIILDIALDVLHDRGLKAA